MTGAASTAEPVDRVLRAVASWGLAVSPSLDGLGLPSREADLAGTGGLVDRAVEQRLIGLVAVASAAGELDLPAEVADLVADRHREALVWCLRIEAQLLHLLERLRAVGIEPVVLKGPAIAHLDEAEPSLRTFADLDLLIVGDEVDRAVAVVEADGASRLWAQRRPGFDRRFAKSVTLRYRDGLEVDLHRSLCDGVHGFRIPLDALFERRVEFPLGGTKVAALSRVHRVLHSAYHLVLGSPEPRLMSLRDLASQLTDPAVDRAEVIDEARRWRGEEVLARAVGTCLDRLEVEAPHWRRWIVDRPTDPAEVAIIERQRVEGSAIGRGKLEALRELPGLRQRLAYGWALAVPTTEHLTSRGLRRRDLVGR